MRQEGMVVAAGMMFALAIVDHGGVTGSPGPQAAADTTITIRASGSTLEFTPTRVSASCSYR